MRGKSKTMHVNNIPTMQLFTGVHKYSVEILYAIIDLSVSGNSEIMLYGTLINIPYWDAQMFYIRIDLTLDIDHHTSRSQVSRSSLHNFTHIQSLIIDSYSIDIKYDFHSTVTCDWLNLKIDLISC